MWSLSYPGLSIKICRANSAVSTVSPHFSPDCAGRAHLLSWVARAGAGCYTDRSAKDFTDTQPNLETTRLRLRPFGGGRRADIGAIGRSARDCRHDHLHSASLLGITGPGVDIQTGGVFHPGEKRRVLEKIGMRREGLLRQRVRKWGRFEDVVVCAVLRGDLHSPPTLKDGKVPHSP